MSTCTLSLAVFFTASVVVMVSGSESAQDYKELVDRIIQLEKRVTGRSLFDFGSIYESATVAGQENLLEAHSEQNSVHRRLTRQLQILESRVSSLLVQQKISNRKQETLEARVTELEEQAINHETTIEQQRAEIDHLKTGRDRKYNDDIEAEKGNTLPVEKQIKRNGDRRGRSFPEVPIAFTAVLDHNVYHSGIDQTVMFNSVQLNDGNAYNNHTGVFTVPREGLYLFYFVFAAGYEPHKLWMHIVVDGQGKAAGIADTLQKGHDAQGTNLVILHLQKGDSVWVATYQYADKSIYGFPAGFTSFSGVLLYEY